MEGYVLHRDDDWACLCGSLCLCVKQKGRGVQESRLYEIMHIPKTVKMFVLGVDFRVVDLGGRVDYAVRHGKFQFFAEPRRQYRDLWRYIDDRSVLHKRSVKTSGRLVLFREYLFVDFVKANAGYALIPGIFYLSNDGIVF